MSQDTSPYCKVCRKYAMWPNNECTCESDKVAEENGLISESKIKQSIGPAFPAFMKFMNRQGYVVIGGAGNYFHKADFNAFCSGSV